MTWVISYFGRAVPLIHVQYSQYNGVVAATPQKSGIPVATIGGEPGGRAPIIVDEPVAQAGPAEEHTSIVAGKAEPGRDIFAGKPINDVQSSHVQHPPAADPPAIEKDISSVLASSSAGVAASMQVEKGGGVAEGSSSPASTVSDRQSTETASNHADTTETSTRVDDALATVGPLLEAEVEANRAAKELYPEAQK
jgi:dolichyl-phosphate-mannose-protein mannosyltransferase